MRKQAAGGGTLEWCEQARAKINLFLAVGRRRDDGYHPVATVIQPVDLCDLVRVRVEKESAGRGRSGAAEECAGARGITAGNGTGGLEIHVASTHPEAPGGPANLAWRAVKLLEERIKAAAPDVKGITVEIEKRIPVAAGLGGGSADAAAVLSGLNRRLCLGLAQSELEGLAARIGSDVPACVAGGSVLCTGRGEVVEPLEARPMWCVLAKPAGGLSTAAVYAEFDKAHPGGAAEGLVVPAGLIAALRRGDVMGLAPHLRNDLQDAAAQLHPGILPLLAELRRAGAASAMLSGSGPAVFGLFESDLAAHAAAKRLERLAEWAWWGSTAV